AAVNAAPASIALDWRPGPVLAAAETTPMAFRPLEAALETRLGSERVQVRSAFPGGAAPEMIGAPDADAAAQRGHMTLGAFDIEITLADGSVLALHASPRRQAAGQRWTLIGYLVVVSGVALAAGVVVARVLTRPIKRFSAAAYRLGRDADPEPLREDGASELKDAAIAFNAMQFRIARFVKDRAMTLAAISHDLRTPLTRHRLRLDALPDEGLRQRLIADVDEMDAMLRSALAFARDQSEAEPVQSLDLAALLRTIADEFEDQGADVSVSSDQRCVLAGRPIALKRLFENVIDNAVRYGGAARIALSVDGDEAIVIVDDDGPGVSASDAERVFEPFLRLDESRNAETGGTGLGLTIARGVARRHGGDVRIAPRLGGRGARIEVTLPT
ncbi:MAG: ATP-binding protein, partial [Pseudomonadota bacterium]